MLTFENRSLILLIGLPHSNKTDFLTVHFKKYQLTPDMFRRDIFGNIICNENKTFGKFYKELKERLNQHVTTVVDYATLRIPTTAEYFVSKAKQAHMKTYAIIFNYPYEYYIHKGTSLKEYDEFQSNLIKIKNLDFYQIYELKNPDEISCIQVIFL